jgi:hypothetical protein
MDCSICCNDTSDDYIGSTSCYDMPRTGDPCISEVSCCAAEFAVAGPRTCPEYSGRTLFLFWLVAVGLLVIATALYRLWGLRVWDIDLLWR